MGDESDTLHAVSLEAEKEAQLLTTMDDVDLSGKSPEKEMDDIDLFGRSPKTDEVNLFGEVPEKPAAPVMKDVDLFSDDPASDDGDIFGEAPAVDMESAEQEVDIDLGGGSLGEVPTSNPNILDDEVLNNLLDSEGEAPTVEEDQSSGEIMDNVQLGGPAPEPAQAELQPEEPMKPASSPRKENPFDRMKQSNQVAAPSEETQESSVENNLDGMDCSLPLSASPIPPTSSIPASPILEKKKQPMVVSVGTIDVAGTFPDKYEDINIMKKGDVPESAAALADATSETKAESNDYESLRDVRFSSVSIYDKPHFEEDIAIVVDDAQKHQAESFVSYKVVTKTTRESWTTHEFHVRRRYQDFLWLAQTLTIQYPTHIIPPLPQKKMFNRYDPDFLRLRQLALNKFLCRIAEHPILSTSEHFFTFLSAKQVELLSQKKLSAPKGFNLPNVLPIGNTANPFEATSEYITGQLNFNYFNLAFHY